MASFVDRVKITAKAGNGGNGCVSFCWIFASTASIWPKTARTARQGAAMASAGRT